MSGSLGRVWLAAFSLCAGTLWGSFGVPRVVAASALVIGAIFLTVRRRVLLSLAAIGLIGLGAGMINADLRLGLVGPLGQMARDVPQCTFRGVILEPVGSLGTLIELTSGECGSWRGTTLGVAAVRGAFEGATSSVQIVAEPGARFHADGWLVPLGSDPFDRALSRAGAQAIVHPSSLDIAAEPTGPHAIAARVRHGLASAVSGLDQRVGGLLKGLTIGDTSDLAAPTIDLFRNAGLSHILAVSGSNVAIVLGAVLVGFRSLGHAARVLFGYLGLGLFVLIVGPDPSVLRAAAMGCITLACLTQGKTAEPLAALGLAIIGVIALRPGMLFSVGMQLSTAATAGIVVFCGPLENKMRAMWPWLRTMLAATFAAQIAVAPILIFVFGEISVIAPLANALALPAVVPGTVIGLAAGSVAVAFPAIGALLAHLVAPAAAWILLVADRAGSAPWSLVAVPPMVGWPVLGAVVVFGFRVLKQASARSIG